MSRSTAIFILTHRRPTRQFTYELLKQSKNTIPVYFICDTSDPTIEELAEYNGIDRRNIFVFEKNRHTTDTMVQESFGNNGVVFARNYAFDAAKKIGVDYMIVLDDDYDCFAARYTKNDKLYGCEVNDNIEDVFNLYVDFLRSTPLVSCVCMAQNGDFIGGAMNPIANGKIKRKAMNVWFFRSTFEPRFCGIMNEDVNLYTKYGARGNVMLTVPYFSIHQIQTQAQAGGLTDIYVEKGTYTKSFLTAMINPVCVSIRMMGDTHKRIHHNVSYRKLLPKIIKA